MGIKFRIDPKWGSSKEQIWQENFAHLETRPRRIVVSRPLTIYLRYASYAAAIIVLMLTPFFYKTHFSTGMAEHSKFLLPDGSVVHLNADSRVSYKPLLWFTGRELYIEGEAYFEVEKGKLFTVSSKIGIVEVLGTTFNLFSRDAKLGVACTSGSVKVTLASSRQSQVIIGAGEYVELSDSLTLIKKEISQAEYTSSWMEKRFNYNSTPLYDVLREIERQYNVVIIQKGTENLFYSGKFSSDINVDELLEIVTLPFSLTIHKEDDKHFIVN